MSSSSSGTLVNAEESPKVTVIMCVPQIKFLYLCDSCVNYILNGSLEIIHPPLYSPAPWLLEQILIY